MTWLLGLPNIALTGKIRSGKDTVAEYLVNRYGYRRYAFGDGIRRVARELYPQYFADGAKPRALLQQFGQMARRFDENVWVNDCFRRINDDWVDYVLLNESGTYDLRFVITDLRQPSEYDRCRREGCVFIRVNAPDELRLERARAAGDDFTVADLEHETEKYVDQFVVDYDVYNVSGVSELYAQIDRIMERLSGGDVVWI